jgi:chromosome segregation ATPase
VPILIGAVVALAIFAVYLFVQVDRTKTDVAKLRESLMTEISNMRATSSVTTEAQKKHLDTLRDQLESARRNAALAVGQAKTEAVRHAEDLGKRLEEEQQKQQQMVATELSQVKEAANSANTKIASVSSDVTTVRNEVASTKSELDKTIATLKTVQGDLGVQSGLIATNSKELSALRTLGERNYFEFDLTKSKELRKIGDVTMRLKKADPKRNRYTIELVADDKLVEKKDRAVNEPVQFYVARARLPYEVVVNEIKKNQVVGYLATPKVQVGRNQ